MLSSMYQLSLDDFARKVSTLQLTIMEWKFALEFIYKWISIISIEKHVHFVVAIHDE